jgi:hypothetical protein
MFRTVPALAAVGVAGIVAWKLLWVMLLPMLFGLVALALKVALIALFIFVLFRVLRRAGEPHAQT